MTSRESQFYFDFFFFYSKFIKATKMLLVFFFCFFLQPQLSNVEHSFCYPTGISVWGKQSWVSSNSMAYFLSITVLDTGACSVSTKERLDLQSAVNQSFIPTTWHCFCVIIFITVDVQKYGKVTLLINNAMKTDKNKKYMKKSVNPTNDWRGKI